MNSDPYKVDYDWLWSRPPGNDGTPATLLLHLDGKTAEIARSSAARWLSTLAQDSAGIRGSGGWRADLYGLAANRVTLALTSGGEDVADGISDAADNAFAQLGAIPGLTLIWEQLPRGRRSEGLAFTPVPESALVVRPR